MNLRCPPVFGDRVNDDATRIQYHGRSRLHGRRDAKRSPCRCRWFAPVTTAVGPVTSVLAEMPFWGGPRLRSPAALDTTIQNGHQETRMNTNKLDYPIHFMVDLDGRGRLQTRTGPPPEPSSGPRPGVMKAVVASLLTALICVSVGWAQDAGGSAARAPFVPACPPPTYGHDGDMAPLFCVIDNPLALRYYGRDAPHLFALGPSATPTQVVAALKQDQHTIGTAPVHVLRISPRRLA